ncbi:hypothetical protein IMY05_C2442000300 [Salix suchowensis]|nr:hypothetical protein IMY05_C2442000300 [Salix suchowensis]
MAWEWNDQNSSGTSHEYCRDLLGLIGTDSTLSPDHHHPSYRVEPRLALQHHTTDRIGHGYTVPARSAEIGLSYTVPVIALSSSRVLATPARYTHSTAVPSLSYLFLRPLPTSRTTTAPTPHRAHHCTHATIPHVIAFLSAQSCRSHNHFARKFMLIRRAGVVLTILLQFMSSSSSLPPPPPISDVSTAPVPDQLSRQHQGETMQAFFEREAQWAKKKERHESDAERLKRMDRVKAASKSLDPGKKGAWVFIWEKDSGYDIRRHVGRREVGDIWSSFSESQRRYNSFRNEWDLCVDFDPAAIPDEDMDDDSFGATTPLMQPTLPRSRAGCPKSPLHHISPHRTSTC